MKLKILFVILNLLFIAVFVLLFSAVFSVIPGSMEAGETSGIPSELPSGIYVSAVLCLLLFLAIVAADVFFIKNMRLFEFLAAENWPALARTLEKQTIGRGKFSKMNVSLLTEVLVLLSDYPTLQNLFSKLKSGKPDLYCRFSPDFTAASIVFGNLEEAEKCLEYASRNASSFPGVKDWLDFYSAFIAMKKKSYEKSLNGFAALASGADDLIVAAVSGYFCSEVIPGKTFGIGLGASKENAGAAALSAKERVLQCCSMEKWNKLCAGSRKRVRAAVIGKTLIDVRAWLFPAG